MKKNLYLVETNANHLIISDDGETRKIFSNFTITSNDDAIKYWDSFNGEKTFDVETGYDSILNLIEDDSSWEEYSKTVDELTEGCKVLASIESNI